MANAKNPLVVIESNPNLIYESFTENGSYEASDYSADGFAAVIVDVPGEEVWYDTYSGFQYTKNIIVPSTAQVDSSHSLMWVLRGAPNIESFSCESEAVYSLPLNFFGDNQRTVSTKLSNINLPVIHSVGYTNFVLPDNEGATLQCGSIGHPITSIQQYAFYSASGTQRGRGWTAHIYVNASTKAEAETILPNAPWGADNLSSYVFHSSVTGEVLE